MPSISRHLEIGHDDVDRLAGAIQEGERLVSRRRLDDARRAHAGQRPARAGSAGRGRRRRRESAGCRNRSPSRRRQARSRRRSRCDRPDCRPVVAPRPRHAASMPPSGRAGLGHIWFVLEVIVSLRNRTSSGGDVVDSNVQAGLLLPRPPWSGSSSAGAELHRSCQRRDGGGRAPSARAQSRQIIARRFSGNPTRSAHAVDMGAQAAAGRKTGRPLLNSRPGVHGRVG